MFSIYTSKAINKSNFGFGFFQAKYVKVVLLNAISVLFEQLKLNVGVFLDRETVFQIYFCLFEL